MTRIYTSYYANLKKLPPEMTPVCISRGKPPWFRGPVYLDLAPTREMLKLSRESYDPLFRAILDKLDPHVVAEELAAMGTADAPHIAMLCWEKPGFACHRRICAEWLENALGITVPEVGIERDVTGDYVSMPWSG